MIGKKGSRSIGAISFVSYGRFVCGQDVIEWYTLHCRDIFDDAGLLVQMKNISYSSCACVQVLARNTNFLRSTSHYTRCRLFMVGVILVILIPSVL